MHPALFTGRSIVAHFTRIRLYTTPRDTGLGNVPDSMNDLIKIAHEESEEIGDSHYEHRSELPVTVGIPEDGIVDHPQKGREGELPLLRPKIQRNKLIHLMFNLKCNQKNNMMK